MSLAITRRRLIARGDLPGSNGGVYNPGAILVGSEILLLCRRELDYRFRSEFVFPELITLDRETLEILEHRTLPKVGYAHDTRIEDFRCIEFGGMRLVVHSEVRPGRIRPAISRMFGDALQRFDEFNLPHRLAPVEKNWVLFERDGVLHCLYKLDPLTIFAKAENGAWRLVKETDNGWSIQLANTLSNSANLIPFDGGYLGFWHTIASGRYVQGAFLLDHDLAIQSRTGVLLDGRDVLDGFKPGVIYVSALVEDGDRILAFYGEGDAHTGVAIFDRAELADELRRSPFHAVDAIRIRFEGDSLSDVFRAIHALRVFSEQRQHPRIRLDVPAAHLLPAFERIVPHNILVDTGGHHASECTVVGRDGTLNWN